MQLHVQNLNYRFVCFENLDISFSVVKYGNQQCQTPFATQLKSFYQKNLCQMCW